jgi:soluble lytic murein transglycosylase
MHEAWSVSTINMKLWFCLFSLFCTLAQAAPGDSRVLTAREVFRNGERIRLAALPDVTGRKGQAGQVAQYDLEPWVEYWQLRQRLDDGHSDGIADFLQRQSGSYLAEKLRGDWLKNLGNKQKWEDFQREFPFLQQPDNELNCYALQGRLAVQNDAAALNEARPLWLGVLDMPESCIPLMERLIVAGRIDIDDVWDRMRRLVETRRIAAAKRTAEYLPTAQMPTSRMLETISDKPQRSLDTAPASFAATRLGREMALFAVQRLARSDTPAATVRWQKIQGKFSEAERGYAWGQIAWQAAVHHLPEAPVWYGYALSCQSADLKFSEEQLAWQVRAALRALDWPLVQRAIAQMPPQMAAQPDWIYWRARALAMQGHSEEAKVLFQKISGQPNFYSNLADGELDRLISIPPRALPPTAEELAAARDNPGLRRALALFRLDMRNEGIREWNWTLRGMNDRQLLAAADLARRSEIFDRAIYSADRTQVQHDYALRYLAPFRESVVPQARDMALDSGWVYGLMRQESRFVMSARSGVGAKGLMQLMPKTAAWVARKIGLKNYQSSQVASMNTNVELGTNYLRMVLASLDNHPLLACAAYNAGPGRARRWRADVPLEGAIYAETIPFDETRDYVKKVMSNSVYYAALFEDKPQSLKSRMGTVSSRLTGTAGATKFADLP